MCESKCCLNLKRELKEIQEKLSSAKLIIKLLQTEGNTNEHVGYGTTEPQNLIQSNPYASELNPICKSQLSKLFYRVFKFCACFSKNLNISRTKQGKFVKQKAVCGE